MSNQKLEMKYHPAKKEIAFRRIVSGKPIAIRNDSKLAKYMNNHGKFVLQDHGDSFFRDIVDVFDGEESVDIDVVTTKTDFEDFVQMVEYYNKDGGIPINTALIEELPDMNETYHVVREHGEKSIALLEEHNKNFFDISLDDPGVKNYVDAFTADINKEINSIREKIDSMSDNLVKLCFAGAYSTGKSALINAIIGFRILPESINSETARMFILESPKANESVRIIFSIGNDYAELCWDEADGFFKFAAGPTENDTRKAIQEIINNNKSEKQHQQVYEILKTLNSNDGVSVDIKIYFPIPLDSKYVQFAIYDTPGTDSNFGEHQVVLQNALSEQTHSILIFVAAPNKTEGEGNSALLSYLKEAEKKDSKTSIDVGRSLFVINWADSIEEEDRIRLQNEKIKDKTDEDFSINLSDKKLFFTSAKYACAAAAVKNNVAAEKEEYIIKDDYNKIIRPGRGQYFLQNRCAASEYATKQMIAHSTAALEQAIAEGNTTEVFHICSGVYALEKEMVLYGEKYAGAVRAFAIIDSVDKALSTMNKNAKSIERKTGDDIDKINREIDEIRKTFDESIETAYQKYELKKSDALPGEILKTLHLDSDSLKDNVFGKTKSFIDKLLFKFFGVVTFNEKHKAKIIQNVTSIMDDYTNEFIKNRKKLIEERRDNFISDIVKAIRDNGEISDEAKEFIVEIKPPEIKKPSSFREFGDIYDSNKRVKQFLFFKFDVIDKEEFMREFDSKLLGITSRMNDDFEQDFKRTLDEILKEIKTEFTRNIENYSLIIRAKIADKAVVEKLHKKIVAAAGDLSLCQDELNDVIWSVKK